MNHGIRQRRTHKFSGVGLILCLGILLLAVTNSSAQNTEIITNSEVIAKAVIINPETGEAEEFELDPESITSFIPIGNAGVSARAIIINSDSGLNIDLDSANHPELLQDILDLPELQNILRGQSITIDTSKGQSPDFEKLKSQFDSTLRGLQKTSLTNIDHYREILKVTVDAEWAIIKNRLSKVLKLYQGGQSIHPNSKLALNRALGKQDDKAIKKSLEQARQKSMAQRAALKEARESLREILNIHQEAELVIRNILD